MYLPRFQIVKLRVHGVEARCMRGYKTEFTTGMCDCESSGLFNAVSVVFVVLQMYMHVLMYSTCVQFKQRDIDYLYCCLLATSDTLSLQR